MTSRPALLIQRVFDRENQYQLIVFIFCVLFGIAMILNSTCAADGVWFGYATLFNRGVKPYSQLHFVLQPLFVLETAAFMRLLGNGWLIMKVPAVLHVLTYTLAILWIVRQLSLNDRQRAVMMGMAFFLTVNSGAYRFDDYHVLAETCVFLSVGLLLALHRSPGTAGDLGRVTLLGLLSALAFETRINDGAALLLGVAICLPCLLKNRRAISLVCFLSVAVLSVFAIVRLTGDSFGVYWTTSVIRAAGDKGGAMHVLADPLRLPGNALIHYVGFHRFVLLLLLFIFACVAWVYVLRPAYSTRKRKNVIAAIITIVLLLSMSAFMAQHGLFSRVFLLSVWASFIVLLYALGVIAAIRAILFSWRDYRHLRWNNLEVLLIIPLGQICSAAMSTGGQLDEVYTPFALFMLLLPVASPFVLGRSTRQLLFAAAGILACFGCLHRVVEPLHWLNEVNEPMFVGRTWYRHPVYGPMYIQRDTLAFIQPVCSTVASGDGRRAGLLSIPFTFANYFCAVPLYRDHVQTWYDISSAASIKDLIDSLQQSPPMWILYESQPETLQVHENLFNGGKPIPYSDLTAFIRKKVDDGSWKVTYTSSYGGAREWTGQWFSQRWFLIRTD